MPKPQQLFLKRNEYNESEKIQLNLSDTKVVFLRAESLLGKTFAKKTISLFSIHLRYLGDAFEK